MGVKYTTHQFSQNLAIHERRQRAVELYLQRKPLHVLAETLGVSIATVSLDLKAVREVWRTASISNYGELKERELSEIDVLEKTYWDAWEASKTSTVKIAKRSKQSPRGSQIEAAEQRTDTHGDPRFLAGIQWCIERRCAILGLNAPTRNLNLNVSVMSDEELERELSHYGLLQDGQ